MNNVVCVCIRAWIFTVGSLKQMTDLRHCAHMASVHYLHGVQQYFGYLVEGKKQQVVTLGTWGWSQTQLAAEFHTTQSNVSKLVK